MVFGLLLRKFSPIPTIYPMNAVEIQDLTKVFTHSRSFFSFSRHFPQRTTALSHLNLTVKAGEIFALLGPNGAGKTTLLKILSDLVIADSGNVNIYGRSLRTDSYWIRSQMSLLLGEERSFYWRLTGRQNLEFFAALYHLKSTEISSRIGLAQELFGIENLDQRYQEYSSGTKQRLALARCFLSRSKLILMDEPTKNLDPHHAPRLRLLLKSFLEEKPDHAIILTTHNIHEAVSLAHRIGILDHGILKAGGTLDELRKLAGLPSASLEELFHHFTYKNDI